MKTAIALISLLFCCNFVFSQKLDKKTQKAFDADFVTADEYLDDNNYNAALPIFLKLLKLDSDNANLQQRIGLCYIYSAHEKEKAIEYLEKAVRNTDINAQARSPKERRAFVDAFFYLGNAFHINYKFKDALKVYEGYLDKITELADRDSLIEKTERQKEICNNAIELTKKSISMQVENLGKSINSAFPEYSPFVNADETVLFFTSK